MPNPDSKAVFKRLNARCSQCGKLETIEFTMDPLELSLGGLCRVGILHKCQNDEQTLLVLYIDQNCTIRNTILMPILQKKGEELERGKTYYVGSFSKKTALVREKDAFILDKTVLKVICEKGPVSLDEIFYLSSELESVLGIRIERPMVENIIKRFIERGLVNKIIMEKD